MHECTPARCVEPIPAYSRTQCESAVYLRILARSTESTHAYTQSIDIYATCDIISPMPDPALEPLKPPEAKQLVRSIVENGIVEFSGHALAEMANDELETTDCVNLLRAGVYNPPEPINGEWRYRVETQRICVVFAFTSKTRMRVVTAWRFKQ